MGFEEMRVIYKGLLTACVMYGAVAWYKLMKYAYARRAIEQCERVGLYACMNVCLDECNGGANERITMGV